MEDFYRRWLENFAAKTRTYNEGAGEDSNEPTEPSKIQTPTDIVFENDSLKMIVKKGALKRQKNFRLQDHLFKFKIITKKPQEHLPALNDLFDFLHAALTHVLESIKSFYKQEDHNIAYLTLHQEPMVNGLNTGLAYFNMILLITKAKCCINFFASASKNQIHFRNQESTKSYIIFQLQADLIFKVMIQLWK